MQWSDNQVNIFNEVSSGSGHTIVEALAGSGKTTTIVEAIKYVPENKTFLLTAFNKKIAEELKRRVHADNGDISTLHSLGLRSLRLSNKNTSVDFDKTKNIIEKILPNAKRDVVYSLIKAINLAKAYLYYSTNDIDNIIDDYDIDTFEMEHDEFIKYVIIVMDICKSKNSSVDFADMIWLPNVMSVSVPKYDIVFVDETQDLNKGQLGLILQAVKAEGRIIAVGDPNQAIYGFAGADIYSMQNIKEKLNAKTLPLSVTYRCPVSVVKEAQKIVPSLQAKTGAIEGSVSHISIAEMKDQAKPGCFILSRKNAPLIGLAMYYIKNSIPTNIQGRDIGENLLTLVKKSKAKDINKFVDYIKKWQVKQIDRLTHLQKSTEQVRDKVDCLLTLSENVDTVSELKDVIDRLFSDVDDSEKIILSTVHKAKGLERDEVYMLLGTFFPGKQEEINLKYVAITRAKKNLYMVVADPKKNKKG